MLSLTKTAWCADEAAHSTALSKVYTAFIYAAGVGGAKVRGMAHTLVAVATESSAAV